MSGIEGGRFDPDGPGLRPPAVVCTNCEFAWHTAAMVEGLRLLGACPRCGGNLDFRREPTEAADDARLGPRIAPHLALGRPRPPHR